ncbi:uncharacterized protein LODBEIA_P43480 [Lodderomyces beijingensis]|uniref:Calcipressin n=1 Tax=Lodderomyces beijingensis TaxID=1775926 RepID=A0ABP0ZPQ7_9ASCO
MRSPTNSLILTNLDETAFEDPRRLIEQLPDDYLIEVVCLPKLSRVVLICESSTAAKNIKAKFDNNLISHSVKTSFSIKDNKFQVSKRDLSTVSIRADKSYLELPDDLDSKRFLISPPMSPQSEWNHWDRREDDPNDRAIYSPEELSNLLWERLGNTSMVRKYQEDADEVQDQDGDGDAAKRPTINLEVEPELLFEGIDNDVPAIILDKADNQLLNEKLPKTSMPPVI